MSSLLLSKQPDAYQARRHLKKSDVNPVLPRHRFVLELHLAGRSVAEIEELSGYAKPTIYSILQSDGIRAVRQQIMANVSDEFEALFPDVVATIKSGLSAPDMSDRLSAADKWLKAHGKYQPSQSTQQTINVTAEDVVFQILNQRDDAT